MWWRSALFFCVKWSNMSNVTHREAGWGKALISCTLIFDMWSDVRRRISKCKFTTGSCCFIIVGARPQCMSVIRSIWDMKTWLSVQDHRGKKSQSDVNSQNTGSHPAGTTHTHSKINIRDFVILIWLTNLTLKQDQVSIHLQALFNVNVVIWGRIYNVHMSVRKLNFQQVLIPKCQNS